MILYRFAIETGLRASEIRSLKVSDFDLVASTVTVSDAYSKNRKTSSLPLRPEMAALLKSYMTGKLPTASVFQLPSPANIVRMFRKDIVSARNLWIAEDPANRSSTDLLIPNGVDFHALRHTCASFLVDAGVDPKVAQEIMRHSTVELTRLGGSSFRFDKMMDKIMLNRERSSYLYQRVDGGGENRYNRSKSVRFRFIQGRFAIIIDIRRE